MTKSLYEITTIHMEKVKQLENRIFALEARIEVEIRFSKMAHDLCNVFQAENKSLWNQFNDLKRQIREFNEKKVL